jgi:hypothetical protein
MTPYERTLAEHRRITILRLLHDGGGAANESILKDGLEDLGLEAGLTRAVVREDLKFLEVCGAIRQEWFGDKLVVAHITERGVDIAKGRIMVEGIKRPSVGE